MSGTRPSGFTLSNGRCIGADAPTFIVAEIGVNHDGDVDTASRLIAMAAEAGADAVKVQILNVDRNYSPQHPSYAVYKRMDLGFDNYLRLSKEARARGLTFFATPDTASLAVVVPLHMPLVKISSGMLTDVHHLKIACAVGVPLVLSTGMSYLDAVVHAVELCREYGRPEIGILQCTSLYPAPAATLNLLAIDTLARATGAVVGFSDHSEGIVAGVAAVACGAKIVEKHITLDRSRPGPEHHFAADPTSFAAFVSAIRAAEAMLGDSAKRPAAAEAANAKLFRRCVVATRDIAAGEVFTNENTGILRPAPGTRGLEPLHYEDTLGLVAAKPIPRGAGIDFAMLGGRALESRH